MSAPRVLFITRKFPPSKGGLERVAFELYTELDKHSDVTLIKWGGSNTALPIILPLHFIRACWALFFNKFDVIYAQDCVLSPLVATLRIIFRVPVVITANGLDLTYSSRFYQMLLKVSLPRLDAIVCISEATKQIALSKISSKQKIHTIVYAVSDVFYEKDSSKSWAMLTPQLRTMLRGRPTLFTNGRLVERKGVAWCINQLMPKLVKQYPELLYVVSGEGKQRSVIETAIKKQSLEKNVVLLGATSEPLLKALYNVTDIFIMPNIPVRSDREGLGIVALEAASCAKPVVASKLEGICDAIQDHKNGLLINPKDTAGYYHVISELLNSSEQRKKLGDKARIYTLERFNWKKQAQAYLDIFLTVKKHN